MSGYRSIQKNTQNKVQNEKTLLNYYIDLKYVSEGSKRKIVQNIQNQFQLIHNLTELHFIY